MREKAVRAVRQGSSELHPLTCAYYKDAVTGLTARVLWSQGQKTANGNGG